MIRLLVLKELRKMLWPGLKLSSTQHHTKTRKLTKAAKLVAFCVAGVVFFSSSHLDALIIPATQLKLKKTREHKKTCLFCPFSSFDDGPRTQILSRHPSTKQSSRLSSHLSLESLQYLSAHTDRDIDSRSLSPLSSHLLRSHTHSCEYSLLASEQLTSNHAVI